MGGYGSGRKPNPDNVIKKTYSEMDIRNIELSLPNYSGLMNNDTRDLKLNGYITGKKCGAFGYAVKDSGTQTTITTAGTYYTIQNNFVVDPIFDFSQSGIVPTIIYQGDIDQYFEIDWHATIKGNRNGMTVHVGIKRNGIIVESTVMDTFLKFLNESQTMSGTSIILLKKGDILDIVVTSDQNGDIIEFDHLTTSINEFFD